MSEKPYRITLILGEYDSDGFWNVFDKTEVSRDKEVLIEILDNIVKDCRNYIKKRILI
ncbi:hypothetical protein QKV40_gp22 [Varidnaviria sp.]|uniref:Uncharacterized protein n=1 Tax=Lokiarchaeia virus SkuldV1 TaxID=3058189 RepID=A0AA46MQ63_9VIRU|nr:hypothetical protein QKV40_gp22 [Varidnaviria sp.]UPO70976.1 hypothetical protein 11324_00022 [Lokiarchaeia virus SkuldV1]